MYSHFRSLELSELDQQIHVVHITVQSMQESSWGLSENQITNQTIETEPTVIQYRQR